MTIDYARIKAWPFEPVEQTYTEKDTMLYALGIGLGADPTDERQLQFVYEKNLKALPTMAVVLGYPGFWMRDPTSGIDWAKVVHGEQSIRIHAPLAASATVIAQNKVARVVDKGKGKGALIVQTREIFDKPTGIHLATLEQVNFCRGDGGYSLNGGIDAQQRSDDSPAPPHELPERTPDVVCEMPTRPEAALIYRLNADRNPLHAEPAFAKAVGFPRPILHGLATLGVAGHALLKTCCDYEPERFLQLQARFSAPVFPGETIRVDLWIDADVVSFRAQVVERSVVALANGRAVISPGGHSHP